jgi:hypothetical protein
MKNGNKLKMNTEDEKNKNVHCTILNSTTKNLCRQFYRKGLTAAKLTRDSEQPLKTEKVLL